MNRTPSQRLADNLLTDGLDRFVTDRRLGAALSWHRIAVELRDATSGQVDVTGQTLRSWYADTLREPTAVA